MPNAMRPVIFGGARRDSLAAALDDIIGGWARWRLWLVMGLHDVLQRYRRSMIGPFWITLSMGVMVGALGVLYAQIFRLDLDAYLPFLSAGFVLWSLLAGILNEGARAFIAAEGLIKQLPSPLSLHIYRVLWTNLIAFGHNIVIFVIVALWFDVKISLATVLFAPGFLLFLINGFWVALLLALLSARFRDIPLVVSNVVQVMFFLTPVIWKPELLPGRPFVLDLNPFYHLLEIVRAPLLGSSPSILNWVVSLGLAIAGWAITIAIYRAFRWRVAYWV